VTALIAHDVPFVAIGGAAASPPLDGSGRVARIADRVVDAAADVAQQIGRRRS
jgi:hypothetical protein